MRLYYDLHLHTALSPCADISMTPNAIITEAARIGLDVIAVTDHNCCGNAEAVMRAGKKAGITVIPGMEVQTPEGHIVTLFPDIQAAMRMQEIIHSKIDFFKSDGNQLLFDEFDSIIGSYPDFLGCAAEMTTAEVIKAAKSLGGAAYPAHIDREYYGIIYNLGRIPPELEISCVEITRAVADADLYCEQYGIRSKYKTVRSSDAHHPSGIYQKPDHIEVSSREIECILQFLR